MYIVYTILYYFNIYVGCSVNIWNKKLIYTDLIIFIWCLWKLLTLSCTKLYTSVGSSVPRSTEDLKLFWCTLSPSADFLALMCHSLLSLKKTWTSMLSLLCLSLCRVPCGRSSLRILEAAMCVSSVGSASMWWSVSAQRESFSIAAALSVTTAAPPSGCPPTPSMSRTVWNLGLQLTIILIID